MAFSFNQLKKIEGNTIKLPALTLTANKGDILAVQSENEYIQRIFAMFNDPKELNSEMITLPDDGLRSVYLFQRDDGLYQRLTVKQTLTFWCGLYQQTPNVEDLLTLCDLHACAYKKIKHLTASESCRLRLASALIQHADVYLFEDPSLMIDLQSKQVLHTLLLHLAKNGGTVLVFTTTLEDAIRLGQKVYRYNERGLQEIEQDKDEMEEVFEETSLMDSSNNQVQLDKVSAKVEDKIFLFNPMEIDYIEAREGQTFLFVNHEEFASSTTIKALEERLQPLGFFRCHRSYLVNLQRVREIIVWSKNSYSLSLDNASKSTIPLSKGNYSKLKELIHL
ncbi:LytTR family transcriptional regulator DNA-binding domain-containing protein [Bacillus sp. Marseille-P3800]|uniref:LytTR family transcriptional regulator DNA-binding domain-containing protein n=1 Tax=Bacillus sp. Marseille-P3800 TaxID=2014782 RepID=UPI000C080846|nr:LytTR family transcriptional regulator DNA-binding domain-containing protein [Bacillus sp. Marseille-P3800]